MSGLSVDFALLDARWEQVDDLCEMAERAAKSAFKRSGAAHGHAAEVSVVFNNDEGVGRLNGDYRGKPKATNVLSFPAGGPVAPEAGQVRLLGDVVLAFETINREAQAQGKTFENHFCHLIVHGVLHLLGYDHESDSCARKMEALEISALALIGVPNPYEDNCDVNPPAP